MESATVVLSETKKLEMYTVTETCAHGQANWFLKDLQVEPTSNRHLVRFGRKKEVPEPQSIYDDITMTSPQLFS